MPTLYIIAGCNGAGKTTAAFTLLPEILQCDEFVNADEIARGLSPFNIDSVAFEAGRIMLARIRHLIGERKDFAFEATLSTRSYLKLIREAKDADYKIVLFYFWISQPLIANERIKKRVKSGGHFIPPNIVERRYIRGLANLPKFISVADSWVLADNSTDDTMVVAQGAPNFDTFVTRPEIWNKINSSK